ncbi:NK2R-like protein, partial [Mya arenaria]
MDNFTKSNSTLGYLELLKLLELELQNMTRNISYKEPDVYVVPLSIVIILAILYGSISMLAVVGNGLVIYVVFKDKRMQTVTNVLIVNLALSDILLGMFTTPFQFQPALHQRWDFPEFMCVIAPSFKVLSVIVSVLTLTFISLDRYVAVMYPLKAGFSKPNAVLSLILIWLFGIASSFPEGYFNSVEQRYDPESRKFKPFCLPTWPSESFGKYYYWYLLCVQYLFPLVIINVAYTRISCRIWGTKAPGVTLDRENVRQRTRRKVVKMLIIVVLLFVLCWMPLQLYNVISEFNPEINKYKYIQVIWFCSNWLAMSNSCYNPFIYGLLN